MSLENPQEWEFAETDPQPFPGCFAQEIDFVIDTADGLVPREIKSGSTFAADGAHAGAGSGLYPDPGPAQRVALALRALHESLQARPGRVVSNPHGKEIVQTPGRDDLDV